MKKCSFILILLLLTTAIIKAQSEAVCGNSEFPWINKSIPFYLKSGFGVVHNDTVAILFVDFPDGRINGIYQPFTEIELSNVNELDAVAEIGCERIKGQLKIIPSKYTYYDRWQLYFSTGTYYGTSHPDYNAYGYLAYGSFKEYYSEVSSEKEKIIPAITHPTIYNDSIRSTGIINRDTLINGRRIIKSIKLDKYKYGDSTNSYLWQKGVGDHELLYDIESDAISKLNELYPNEIDFNINNYHGKIIVVVSGGLQAVGGQAFDTTYLVVRSSQKLYYDTTKYNRMDGLRIPVHEFGHLLGFEHIDGGRYCPMNPVAERHDMDCPSHFNPVLKIQRGWLAPIAIEYSQQYNNLPPIETSHQCGIVTISGKPSASPDWSTGEYYVLENRRRIGFDRKIIFDTVTYSDFMGGLMIWQFSPYNTMNNISVSCQSYTHMDYNIKIEDPNSENASFCGGNIGNPTNFFGYYSDYQHLNLDSNRTYTAEGLKTGLRILNINQQQTTNSGINFLVNYSIEEPPDYDYVIYSGNDSSFIKNLNGIVYFHNAQDKTAFRIIPGTIIESSSHSIAMNGIKAYGNSSKNITFRGAGYDKFRSLLSQLTFDKNSLDDSLIFSYCSFSNLTSNYDHSISIHSRNIPLVINNINILDTSVYLKLIGSDTVYPGNLSFFNNNRIPKISIDSNWNFYINNNFAIDTGCTLLIPGSGALPSEHRILFYPTNDIQCMGDLIVNNNFTTNGNINIGATGKFLFYNTYSMDALKIKLSPDKGINCFGEFKATYPTNYPTIQYLVFDRFGDSGFWNGINCINPSNVYLFNARIKHASTGIEVTQINSSKLNILKSRFYNNNNSDISLLYVSDDGAPGYISNNIFYDTSVQYYGVGLSGASNMFLDSNLFSNVNADGIFLDQSYDIKVIGNRIYASLQSGSPSPAGIHSYLGDGFYGCNLITNFYDGILLDNSSPYLLNNNIWNNGHGLYLTNNSTPVMSPSHSPNQNLYNAGYNKIYNNLNEEIFCDNNWGFYFNSPYIYQGYNSIYDSLNDPNNPLINCDLIQFNNPVQGQYNFWGKVPYNQMFTPQGCVIYTDYLTRDQNYSNCLPYLTSGNNDSLNQESLMFGSANINTFSGNYISAINGYKQYLDTYGNVLNPLIASKVFNTGVKAKANFSEIAYYYENLASRHFTDTTYHKHLRNLMIGSHVQEPLFQQAISEYQNIIDNSQDQQEIYYATIEQTRTIELMLDPLYNHHGGDNPGGNNYSNHQLISLINGLLNNNFNSTTRTLNKTGNNKSLQSEILFEKSKLLR